MVQPKVIFASLHAFKLSQAVEDNFNSTRKQSVGAQFKVSELLLMMLTNDYFCFGCGRDAQHCLLNGVPGADIDTDLEGKLYFSCVERCGNFNKQFRECTKINKYIP